MSKTMQWVIGIAAVLFLGGAITMLILWKKEKDKNTTKNTTPTKGGAASTTSGASTQGVAGDTTTPTGTVARFSN